METSRWRLAALALAALLAWQPVRSASAQRSVGDGGGAAPVDAARDEPRTPATLRQAVYECFVRADYEQAVALINQHLKESPNDSDMLYNLACAQCMLQRVDEAASALLRAVRAGFNDFEHMRGDPDLDALREHPIYARILEEADKASARVIRNALDHWKQTYGVENYQYVSDATRRLNYAVALDEHAFEGVKRMLERQADQVTHALFDGVAPTYDVLIAIPSPADSDKFFNGRDNIGGIYQHPMRRLVARDVGGSLRHEFFHALHYAHMERIRQRHPLWIQEGLATLYEDYDLEPDGTTIRFLPNDRQVIVKARARSGRLIRWEQLFKITADGFMDQAQRNYPQVRSIFEFIADEGKLEAWYKAYVRTYREDPTSAKAFEEVFELPLSDIERRWRRWVVEQPSLDLNIGANDAALGIRSADNLSNDGVHITDIIANSTAARSRLRRGDVIVSADGRATPTMIDLRRVIAAKQVGDEIELKVRRRDEYITMRLILRPLVGGY